MEKTTRKVFSGFPYTSLIALPMAQIAPNPKALSAAKVRKCGKTKRIPHGKFRE